MTDESGLGSPSLVRLVPRLTFVVPLSEFNDSRAASMAARYSACS